MSVFIYFHGVQKKSLQIFLRNFNTFRHALLLLFVVMTSPSSNAYMGGRCCKEIRNSTRFT